MKTNDIQKKIAELQAEAIAIEQCNQDVFSVVPESELVVWHNSKLSEFGLIYHFRELDDVRKLVEVFSPYILPLSLYKGTFTMFRTPEHPLERGEKLETDVFPITVKVGHFGIKFEFYALINDHLLSVDIESEFNSGWQRFASVYFEVIPTRSRQGRETEHVNKEKTILSTPAFNVWRTVKWWGSGDYPNDYTLYWLPDINFEDIFR